jgi:hypothetical protein
MVPVGPVLVIKFPPPKLYVTVAEGVPVKVNCDVPPEQIGLVAETVTFREEVTLITIFNGAEQVVVATCVKLMVRPAGQAVTPAPKMLPGPIFATPAPLKTKVPVAPEEVLQLNVALAVPVKLMVADEPGHRLVEEVRAAVGTAFTVMVPVALTVPHPPTNGME